MTVPETAKYLRISKESIYRMVKKNKIPVHRIGEKLWRFHAGEIDQWVKENNSGSKRGRKR